MAPLRVSPLEPKATTTAIASMIVGAAQSVRALGLASPGWRRPPFNRLCPSLLVNLHEVETCSLHCLFELASLAAQRGRLHGVARLLGTAPSLAQEAQGSRVLLAVAGLRAQHTREGHVPAHAADKEVVGRAPA